MDSAPVRPDWARHGSMPQYLHASDALARYGLIVIARTIGPEQQGPVDSNGIANADLGYSPIDMLATSAACPDRLRSALRIVNKR